MNNVINYCFHLSCIFQINKWSKLRIISFSKPVSSSKSRLIIGPLHVTPLLVMIIGGMKGQTMAPRIKNPFDSFLIWFNLRTGIVAAARWNESGGTPFFTGENPEEYHLNRLQLTLVCKIHVISEENPCMTSITSYSSWHTCWRWWAAALKRWRSW